MNKTLKLDISFYIVVFDWITKSKKGFTICIIIENVEWLQKTTPPLNSTTDFQICAKNTSFNIILFASNVNAFLNNYNLFYWSPEIDCNYRCFVICVLRIPLKSDKESLLFTFEIISLIVQFFRTTQEVICSNSTFYDCV